MKRLQWNKHIILWIALGLLIIIALCAYHEQTIRWWWQDVTFYQNEHTETELKIKAFTEEHDLFFAQYPENLISLLERNPETEDFVLSYPFHKPVPVDVTAYRSSETVPLFLQWDKQWGYEIYGSDMLAITGCGPTCLAMAGFHLTGSEDFTPDQMARFAEAEGYYAPGYGSTWTLFSEGAEKLGLTVQELPLEREAIDEALEAGHLLILSMGPGHFTTAGHFILLTGLEEEGYRVNDPNSILRSQQLWPYETIEDQIRNIWEIFIP